MIDVSSMDSQEMQKRLRNLGAACAVLVGAFILWQSAMTRSVAIRLDNDRYDLSFTMAWGWGMSERLRLTRPGAFFSTASSSWIEIWKKPYNSGLSIYRSSKDGSYYFGSGYKLFRFDPTSGKLTESCEKSLIPARSPLGERLAPLRSGPEADALDPGARRLFTYIEAGQNNDQPSHVDSKYYLNLTYLGSIGLLRPTRDQSSRGGDVTFAPANKAPEPRLSLDIHCG